MQQNKKKIIFLALIISLLIPRAISAQDSENKIISNNLWRNIYCAFNWRNDSSCINNQISSSIQESLSENKITINSSQDPSGLTVLQIYSVKGDKGDTGPTGESGPIGSQGIPGTASLKGDKGDPGTAGGTGAKGDRGDKGDTGAQGPAGTGGLSTTCSDGQILKWSNGEWICSADAGGASYTTNGNGLELNVTQLSLELDGGSLSVSPSGLKIADTYDDNFALTTGSYSNPAWVTSLAGSKITGDISGNAGSVTNGIYTTTDFAGDLTGKYNLLTLANSGVTAGTYGDTGANLTQITVNSKGQITSASNRVLTKANLGLGNVENTALSTWTGTGTLTTLGTVTTGTWNASDISLGSYTSGNYVASVSNGSGISGGSSGSEGSALILSLDINGLTAQSGGISDDDLIAVYDTSSTANRKLTRSQLLAGVTGALVYQGTWSATSNSPLLNDTTGVQGKYYVASDDGSVDFDAAGERSALAFTAGDWAVHNGTRWEKLDNANNVQSVFGRQGVVTASNGDYTASQIGNSAVGNIATTNVQDALNELDTEKQALIATGTNSQYYRGDKSWQTLDKTVVGLGNVENTTLSTWTGSTNITTLGTIVSGTWNGSDIALGTRTSGNYVAGATSLGGLVLTGAEGGSLGIKLDGSTLSVGESGIKIADGLTSNWNTAYAWGNHANANYLTANSSATLTNKSGNISQWTNDTAYITDGNTNWNNSYDFITGLNVSQVTNGSGVYFDYKPNNTACSDNQTLKYTTGTGWLCADNNYVSKTGDTINGDLTINGNVTINGNILPGANNTYNLGSTAAQWNEIFASTNTIYIGGVPLSNNSGSLTWNGSALGSGGGTTTLQNISSGSTLVSWTRTIKADATSASVVVTLPTASGNSGQAIEIIKIDNSTNTIRITPNNGQTINGSVNPIYIYSQNDSVVIRSDGSNSFIVADNRSSVGASKNYIYIKPTVDTWDANHRMQVSSIINSYGNDITNPSTGIVRFLPGKTYKVTAQWNGNQTAGGANVQFYNETTSAFVGQAILVCPPNSGSTTSCSSIIDYIFTPTVQTDLSVRDNGGNLQPSAANSYIYAEVISTPQNVINTVDYTFAKLSADQTSNKSTGDHIKFNVVSGTIALDTTSTYSTSNGVASVGRFTLKAGKTYSLEAGADNLQGTGSFSYAWYDATTGTQISSSNQSSIDSGSAVGPTTASAIFTPAQDTLVEVRIVYTTNANNIIASHAYAKVIQIGFTANTGITMNSLLSAAGNGALDNLNFGQIWNWNTLTTGTALSIGVSSLTTGSALSLTSTSSSFSSTNGLLYVANIGSTNGVVARIQSNSTAGSGLTVLASGNVGIGTTNPGFSLDVNGKIGMMSVMMTDSTRPAITSAGINGELRGYGSVGIGSDGGILRLRSGGGTNAGTASYIDLIGYTTQTGSRSIYFGTAGADRMMIGDSGFVGIGTTAPDAWLTIQHNNTNTGGIKVKGFGPFLGYAIELTPAIDGATAIRYNNTAGTLIGSITTSNSATAYNTTSDLRLKENVTNTHYGVLDLMKINVNDFDFKNDPEHRSVNGFLAQELYKIYPDAVTVGTNDVDKNNNLINPWSVDYGRLTPLIVKSIQDQQQEITQNSDQITTLDLRVKNTEENLNQEKLTEISNKITSLEDRLTQITDASVTFKHNVEFQGPAIFKKIAEFIDKVVFKENVTLEKQLCFKKADGSEICLDADKVEKLINTLPTESPISITPSPTVIPTPESQPQADPPLAETSSITPTEIPSPTPTETPSVTPTETPINN